MEAITLDKNTKTYAFFFNNRWFVANSGYIKTQMKVEIKPISKPVEVFRLTFQTADVGEMTTEFKIVMLDGDVCAFADMAWQITTRERAMSQIKKLQEKRNCTLTTEIK